MSVQISDASAAELGLLLLDSCLFYYEKQDIMKKCRGFIFCDIIRKNIHSLVQLNSFSDARVSVLLYSFNVF